MTKKRVTCPECGYGHTIEYGVQAKTIGVRSGPGGGKGQFNYEITMPEHASSETVRFSTIGGDLLITCAIGIVGGGTLGLIWAAIIGPYYPFHVRQTVEVQAVLIGCGLGVSVCWSWLHAETNQRLKRVLPWFIKQRAAWAAGKEEATSQSGVALTIDHRYRDGLTEAGRTIQYFGTLPVDVDRFNRWAAAVLGSDTMPAEPLAYMSWVGLKKGKLFSRTEYEPLLAHLVEGGTVVNLPGKGHVLTGGGRWALRQHLKATTPPTALEAHAYA